RISERQQKALDGNLFRFAVRSRIRARLPDNLVGRAVLELEERGIAMDVSTEPDDTSRDRRFGFPEPLGMSRRNVERMAAGGRRHVHVERRDREVADERLR